MIKKNIMPILTGFLLCSSLVFSKDVTVYQGLGQTSNLWIRPATNSENLPIYIINIVEASAIFDEDGKIINVFVDQFEISSPNSPTLDMPHFEGWPGIESFPAYNHEKYIEQAIRSVIEQTYKNIELIIINDGSSDNTWNIILSMQEECNKRFKRVVFKTQANQGTCITLNALISIASGEYIALIASDDVYYPQALEKLVYFLVNNPEYVLVVPNSKYIAEDNKEIRYVYVKNSKEHILSTFKDYYELHLDFDFKSDRFGHYYTFLEKNYIPNFYSGDIIAFSMFYV